MTIRDRRTGRYTHTWGWQGFDANGHQSTRPSCSAWDSAGRE